MAERARAFGLAVDVRTSARREHVLAALDRPDAALHVAAHGVGDRGQIGHSGIWVQTSEQSGAAFLGWTEPLLRGVRSQEGKMTVKPELRNAIRFERINLNGDRWPVAGRFDLIFCRNVLIYFDHAAKLRVVQRLLDHLDPAGYFFLGHSETLNMLERVRSVGPTVYQLRNPK